MARSRLRPPSPPTLVVQRLVPHLAIAGTLSAGFQLLLPRSQLHARLQLPIHPRHRFLPQPMVASPSFFPLGVVSASPTTLTTRYLSGQVRLAFRLGDQVLTFYVRYPGCLSTPSDSIGTLYCQRILCRLQGSVCGNIPRLVSFYSVPCRFHFVDDVQERSIALGHRHPRIYPP